MILTSWLDKYYFATIHNHNHYSPGPIIIINKRSLIESTWRRSHKLIFSSFVKKHQQSQLRNSTHKHRHQHSQQQHLKTINMSEMWVQCFTCCVTQQPQTVSCCCFCCYCRPFHYSFIMITIVLILSLRWMIIMNVSMMMMMITLMFFHSLDIYILFVGLFSLPPSSLSMLLFWSLSAVVELKLAWASSSSWLDSNSDLVCVWNCSLAPVSLDGLVSARVGAHHFLSSSNLWTSSL